MGERVNKIRFVGSINKEARFRKSVTRIRLLGEKGRNAREEKRRRESCDFVFYPGKGETNGLVMLISIVLMIN